MFSLEFIQAAQTVALVAVAIAQLAIGGAVVYAFVLLQREIKQGMATLLELLRTQRETDRRTERRLDEIERRERERGGK